MRKKWTAKEVLPWAAVAIWMVVIFLLSGQTAKESGDLSGGIVQWFLNLLYRNFDSFSLERQLEITELWHVIIRKGAHFTEYAILSMLLANALRPYPLTGLQRWLLPVGISALYAVTDEVHQYFVPERACRLLDMGIDTCGAIFGLCIFTAGYALLTKRKKQT